MRLDPFGNVLHVRMHFKHGAYFYVKDNKWHKIGADYTTAMQNYAAWVAPSGGIEELVRVTFDSYVTRVEKGKLSASSLVQYSKFREIITEAFAEFSPSQVRAKHCSAFLEFYYPETTTANGALTVLRGIFDKGVRLGLCDFNPARQIQGVKAEDRDRYITDAEFMAIRSEAKPYLKLIMDMCYLTAQRIGDVLHIKQSDISDAGIYFKQSKTKKRLLVESSPALTELVTEARKLNKVAGLYLFTKTATHSHSYGTVRLHWVNACDKAGVEDARLHDLRAKAITDADAEGLDAQKLAGHATPAMTEKYLRLRRTDRVQSPGKVRMLRQV